jgi:NAD(P)-dependent dehydrogenase (short-subunit alcohol dehydrogenase family)
MATWSTADIPSLDGRTAVVTGANSGIGRAAAGELARAGAHVVLACRDTAKGDAAARGMTGSVEVRELDLADHDSVAAFAAGFDGPLHLLVNNAGVMAPPLRRTAQGFELQIGTNHLGHFALTGRLLARLHDADAPRVVNVASGAHRMGRMNFDDLQSQRGYNRWRAYGQSKLANLLFTFELQRRAAAAGSPLLVTAAHPGYAATNLQSHTESIQDQLMWVFNQLVAQSEEAGAWPTLMAATADLPGGAYVGPDGIGEMRGRPHLVGTSSAARDAAAAARLWTVSEELTGVHFDFGVVAAA